MPEESDLAFLCRRKYVLLAKLREEGLSPDETTELSEIETKILRQQKQDQS